MRYTAKHRFADVGPRKIRPFANLIRGKNVDEALQLLSFYPNRGAKLLMAVVQSAYGNADSGENPHPEPDDLVVAECRVDGAPMFKRIQPRARGTAFQIKRRMSHIVVALVDPEDLMPSEPMESETEMPPAATDATTPEAETSPAETPQAPETPAPGGTPPTA